MKLTNIVWLLLIIGCALAFSSCQKRSSLSPDKAFIGHWRGYGILYVGPKKLVFVTPNGDREANDYEISRLNEVERVLRYKIPGTSMQKELRFAKDNLSFTETVFIDNEPLNPTEPLQWTYVDNKQEP